MSLDHASFRRARLQIEITGDYPALSSVELAMLPEARLQNPGKSKGKQKRGTSMKVSSRTEGKIGILAMEFSSDDLVSLRASINTNLRLVSSALNTLKALSDG